MSAATTMDVDGGCCSDWTVVEKCVQLLFRMGRDAEVWPRTCSDERLTRRVFWCARFELQPQVVPMMMDGGY